MSAEVKFNVSQSRGYENANLELIKVTTNEQGQKLVSGRELHEVLKVEKAFSTWIQTQLENVDAIENQDFCTSFKGNANLTQEEMREMSPQQRSAYGVSVDYVLTLDIAKEICMCVGVAPRTNEETRQLSKAVRKYFIECEKVAQNPYANLSPELKAIFAIDNKQQELERQQKVINQRLTDIEENAKLEPGEYNLVAKRVSSRIRQIQEERGWITQAHRSELFKGLNGDILQITGVRHRTQLRQKHLDMVLDFINEWYPSQVTLFNINQMSLGI